MQSLTVILNLRYSLTSLLPKSNRPLHNVILLFNFPPIILILAFPLLVFNSISITLLIPIIYPPPMSILPLVNGPPVMYPLSFNYAERNSIKGFHNDK